MEYAVNYDAPTCDNQGIVMDEKFYKYVGWDLTRNPIDRQFFSKENVAALSRRITELLKCVRPDNRPIVVTDEVIGHVMSSVYNGYLPLVGDIYTTFQIPSEEPRDDLEMLNRLTIQVITSQIKDEELMRQNNEKLTIWTSVLGDFNDHGLRQFTTIRTNKKNINKLRFNMNY